MWIDLATVTDDVDTAIAAACRLVDVMNDVRVDGRVWTLAQVEWTGTEWRMLVDEDDLDEWEMMG